MMNISTMHIAEVRDELSKRLGYRVPVDNAGQMYALCADLLAKHNVGHPQDTYTLRVTENTVSIERYGGESLAVAGVFGNDANALARLALEALRVLDNKQHTKGKTCVE